MIRHRTRQVIAGRRNNIYTTKPPPIGGGFVVG
jgi:hypothetical protein